MKFNVAISYCSADAWLAKDLYALLSQPGYSVYCYEMMPDVAHGELRARLQDIYYESQLNVMLWSKSYDESLPDSFPAMERRAIRDRHVDRGEFNSLFVVRVDSAALAREFQSVLAHSLFQQGVLGLQKNLIDRLTHLSSFRSIKGKRVVHPPAAGREGNRSGLTPCEFSISSNYKNDKLKRWQRCADILVDFPNQFGIQYVYLIPSGLTDPSLAHPARIFADPNLLERKRRASILFASENMGKMLKGFWFTLRKNEIDVVTIYCEDYDEFLNASLHDFPS